MEDHHKLFCNWKTTQSLPKYKVPILSNKNISNGRPSGLAGWESKEVLSSRFDHTSFDYSGWRCLLQFLGLVAYLWCIGVLLICWVCPVLVFSLGSSLFLLLLVLGVGFHFKHQDVLNSWGFSFVLSFVFFSPIFAHLNDFRKLKDWCLLIRHAKLFKNIHVV